MAVFSDARKHFIKSWELKIKDYLDLFSLINFNMVTFKFEQVFIKVFCSLWAD